MSRTDAHAPYWTWATWYEPSHGSHRHQACDLPTEPVRANPSRRPRYPRDGWMSCFWRPVHPNWRQSRKIYGNTVPRWYVDHVWSNAERVRVRDGLSEIRKEYSAWGYFDGDFPNWQHRHGAAWDWD